MKQTNDVVFKLKKVRSKKGGFHLITMEDESLTIIVRNSGKLDKEGCEIWDAILKDRLPNSR